MSNNDPDRYAVVGFPVKHSWSPFIHGMFAKQTGQQLTYRLLEVSPEDFATQVQAFFDQGGKGLNITVPHKRAAVGFAKHCTPRAQIAGAVNTLANENGAITGDNTDGAGLVTDLQKNLGFELHDKRILLLGTGGAARGIMGPLLACAPKLLTIAHREVARAKKLAREFTSLGKIQASGFENSAEYANGGYDLILNATSASLQNIVPSISSANISPTSWCYDLAYGRGDTPFTRWATEQGAARAYTGWGMLVEQAAESFLLWRGVRPDTQSVLEAIKDRESSSAEETER
jgi:shikimate dehydrogenase